MVIPGKGKKPGSLKGEMKMSINKHTEDLSNSVRRIYITASAGFLSWKKAAGLSNNYVRMYPRSTVEAWRDYLRASGYAASTIHTYIAGVCCGLGISMAGIVKAGTSAQKTKSLGNSARSRQARMRKENGDIVRFQEMVGGRRSALQRLTGSDLVRDESGHWCVRFIRDKGGKNQLQRIAPENVEEVRAYFESCAPDQRIFPEKIDTHLDLHQIRAEHARAEYQRYAKICSTPEGRIQMRRELLARFINPTYGCKAFLQAKAKGQTVRAGNLLNKFGRELKDGTYWLHGDNREVALERGRPVGYDRLALCCVSVFALSHWRNEVTAKHYMI